MNRVIAISRKEFYHIIRDPRTLLILFIMPVLMLVVFGYALNMEVRNVPLAVVDQDGSAQAADLVNTFAGSDYFSVQPYSGPVSELESLFLERRVRAILIIGPDFETDLQRRRIATVQVLIDGADPNAALSIRTYVNGVVEVFNQRHNTRIPAPFAMEPTLWFNPDMESAYFFVPGILALLLVMISALLTSITITREKETGTLEQILVSPIHPFEIILGKVLPYIGLAFLNGMLILLIGMLLFDVPFAGSLVLFVLLTLLFVVTALSLGLMISTVVSTQQVAMMLALVATLLPTLMLSGFMFPIASMPLPLQWLSWPSQRSRCRSQRKALSVWTLPK